MMLLSRLTADCDHARRISSRRIGPYLLAAASVLLTWLYSSIYIVIESSFTKLRYTRPSGPRWRWKNNRGKRLPYYQRWDPITRSINIPIQDRHDVNKPTSLELLQEILHSDSSSPSSSSSSSSSSVYAESCFRPNIQRTRELAERIEKSSKSKSKTSPSVGLPLLNVGFPKSGSSTLRTFLRQKLHWNASHYSLKFNDHDSKDGEDQVDDRTSPSLTVGEQMIKAANEGLSPFALLSNSGNNFTIFQAHTQLDYTSSNQNFFPQIQLLDEIHMAEPNSTFVLLFRPVNDWIRSTQSWHFYPIRWANSDRDLPDLGSIMTPQQRMARDQRGEKIMLTEEQLQRWWCVHVTHVRKFVETYPSHNLIELDLYDTDGSTTELLPKLFGSELAKAGYLNRNNIKTTKNDNGGDGDENSSLWSAANTNPVVKEKGPGPSSMKIHYYQLWNHSSNTMGYLNETSKDRYFGTDRPTSLEILEGVMKKRRERDNVKINNNNNINKSNTKYDGNCFYPQRPKESKIHAVTNSSFPIIHVGLPLVGNEFLKIFFRSCLGLQATSKKVSGGGLVGKKMMEAVHAGLPPVSGYFGRGRSAFLQLDYTQVLPNTASSKFEEVAKQEEDAGSSNGGVNALPISAFPQIQLLDEIHEDIPHATFILPFRSTKKKAATATSDDDHGRAIQDWIDLAQNFHNFTERWAAMEDLPGLVLTEEQKQARTTNKKRSRGPDEPMLPLSDGQLRDWWCDHVSHIRKFVETYPSHTLLEINLSEDHETTMTTLLSAFPQADPTCLSSLLNETNML